MNSEERKKQEADTNDLQEHLASEGSIGKKQGAGMIDLQDRGPPPAPENNTIGEVNESTDSAKMGQVTTMDMKYVAGRDSGYHSLHSSHHSMSVKAVAIHLEQLAPSFQM